MAVQTELEQAQELYAKLKPLGIGQYRDYVMERTPAPLQQEMPGVIDTDISSMASAAVVPSVVDRPYVSQTGLVLNCTLGNWNGTPTSRTYTWKRDNVTVGGNTATLTITAADAGHVYFCSMVATNAAGPSAASASNAITAV